MYGRLYNLIHFSLSNVHCKKKKIIEINLFNGNLIEFITIIIKLFNYSIYSIIIQVNGTKLKIT